MGDTYLDTSPIEVDSERVTHTQFIVKAKHSLARVDKVSSIVPNVESNQVRLQDALEEFFPLEEVLKDG
jgi:uncharacterized membrane protein YjjP (DUF1212 family)